MLRSIWRSETTLSHALQREQSSQTSRIDHHKLKAVLAGRRVEAS
jgi:hypothetical protein